MEQVPCLLMRQGSLRHIIEEFGARQAGLLDVQARPLCRVAQQTKGRRA